VQKSERLVAIALLLQTRGKMTADRLASILEVSVRTIYRDMDTLSLAHVPVTMDYGPGGGYFLPDDFHLDPTTFTSEEAVALALGGAMAGGYRLFESGDGLRRALFKLEAALPEEFRADVRAARERILFDTTEWYTRPTRTEHLETLRSAVWGARQVDMLYPRSNGPDDAWRRAEPHGLVCKAGVWYLVAYCQMRKGFRTFRVDRIRDLHIREEATNPRPGFDLQRYWEEARDRFERQTAPFALTLSVAPSVFPKVRSEATVLSEDPAGWMRVRVDVSSADDAIKYALGLGSGAIVVDPPEVRAAVAQAARELVAQYQESFCKTDGDATHFIVTDLEGA
jgi:predicted DNA-binding transcriptional regulator YafY